MIVQVSAREISLPHMCACCGALLETGSHAGYPRVLRSPTFRRKTAWSLPYCNECKAHRDKWPEPWSWRTWLLVIVTASGWLLVRLVMDAFSRQQARSLCGKSCIRPTAAAMYWGEDGSAESFDLGSPVFAMEFVLANRDNVVNLASEMKTEVEHYIAHQSNPTMDPSSAVFMDASLRSYRSKDELTLGQTLAQLQALKERAARRAVLESAFGALEATRARERLVIEAAGIEVLEVMGETDALTTQAEKRRHVVAAVKTLCDEEPTHPQLREVVDLEVRLLEKALGTQAARYRAR